ncbi:MAG: HipA domain-containing protein [Gammaproteobacteria bacterium]|nr:HipA domain-containing protein [Gammaproteobacteria bacterium]
MDQKRRTNVVLGVSQQIVGELIFEERRNRQSSAFRYVSEWLENPLSFAIAPNIELTDEWHYFSGSGSESLPGPVADAGPDSWGRTILQTAAGLRLNEMEVVLSVNDQTRMGALRFIDENGNIMSTSTNAVPRLNNLANLRQLIVEFEKGEGDLASLALQLRGTGDSLGGARPKSALFDGEYLAIAKYTSERDTMPVERMEVATLNMAREVGIRASLARLEGSDSSYPLAILQRFDRRENGRVHYISARSFLGLHEDHATAYYTDLSDGMRRHCGNGEQTIVELNELYRRILFSILVSNNDDHLKNHGFLYAGNGRWQLSPAFDINPQPFRHSQLKTGISESSGFTASIEAAIESSAYFQIGKSEAAALAFEMARTIKNRWKHWCREAGMLSRDYERYSPAFEHSEMEIALKLGQSFHRA